MKTNMITYLSLLFSLLIFDGIWLGLVAKDGYQQAMGCTRWRQKWLPTTCELVQILQGGASEPKGGGEH